MDGVTVLNITSRLASSYSWLTVFYFLGAVLIVIALIMCADDDLRSCAFIPVIIGIVSIGIGAISIDVHQEPVYWVTLSDNVSAKEFNIKYEIIETDGLILHVAERQPT